MAKSSRSSSALLVVALVLVGAALAATLFHAVQPRHVVRAGNQPPLPSPTSAASTDCAGPTLRVLTASSFAPVLRALRTSLGRGSDCTALDVQVRCV